MKRVLIVLIAVAALLMGCQSTEGGMQDEEMKDEGTMEEEMDSMSM
jgi:hypothetical protein